MNERETFEAVLKIRGQAMAQQKALATLMGLASFAQGFELDGIHASLIEHLRKSFDRDADKQGRAQLRFIEAVATEELDSIFAQAENTRAAIAARIQRDGGQ